MTDPEWHKRRTVQAEGPDGRLIPVSTGVLQFATGPQAVIQVADGPVVVLDLEVGSHLAVNVEHSLLDAQAMERRRSGS